MANSECAGFVGLPRYGYGASRESTRKCRPDHQYRVVSLLAIPVPTVAYGIVANAQPGEVCDFCKAISRNPERANEYSLCVLEIPRSEKTGKGGNGPTGTLFALRHRNFLQVSSQELYIFPLAEYANAGFALVVSDDDSM